jgi:hypothetical protein
MIREPLMPFWRRGVSLPSRISFDALDRMTWGEDGIEWLEIRLGGVVEVLLRLIVVLRLVPT